MNCMWNIFANGTVKPCPNTATLYCKPHSKQAAWTKFYSCYSCINNNKNIQSMYTWMPLEFSTDYELAAAIRGVS